MPWSPESPLGDSSFTCGFLVEKLKSNCEPFKEILANYNVENVSAHDISEGNGYLSRVYKCDFTFVPATATADASQDTLPKFSVILKQPGLESIDASMQDMAEIDEEARENAKKNFQGFCSTFHRNECRFYDSFSHTSLPLAACYGTGEWFPQENEAGFIVMQFLSQGRFPELHEGFSEAQTWNLVRFVLDLQAFALQNEELCKDRFVFVNFGDSTDKNMGEIMLKRLKTFRSESFGKKIDRLSKFFTDEPACKFVGGDGWKAEKLTSLLVHGDLWCNNVCMKRDVATGELLDEIEAVVDWQVVHMDNPMTDICRVLCKCCDAPVRRAVEAKLIDFYMEELGKRLPGHSLPFDRAEVEKSKRYADCLNLMFAVFMPVIHYRGDAADVVAKRERYLDRLEALIDDKLPMMEEYFPNVLSEG